MYASLPSHLEHKFRDDPVENRPLVRLPVRSFAGAKLNIESYRRSCTEINRGRGGSVRGSREVYLVNVLHGIFLWVGKRTK